MTYDDKHDDFDEASDEANDDAYDEAYEDSYEAGNGIGPEDADLLSDELGSIDQVPCPVCGKFVLEELGLCPHCGHNMIEPLESESRMNTWLGPIAIVLLITLYYLFRHRPH